MVVYRRFGMSDLCVQRDGAARAEDCPAAVRPSSLAATFLCFFLRMCMSSMPVSVLGAASTDVNPGMGRVTLCPARCACATPCAHGDSASSCACAAFLHTIAAVLTRGP